MKYENATLEMLIGLPRSGKSTYAKDRLHQFKREGAAIVNPDSIRLALHGQRFAVDAEPFVWAIATVMVDALFRAGHDTVILDATNLTEKRREPWVKWADAHGVTLNLFIVNTTADECVRRAMVEKDYEIIPIIQKMAAETDIECIRASAPSYPPVEPETHAELLVAGERGRA